jgi:WD40 repeat protein
MKSVIVRITLFTTLVFSLVISSAYSATERGVEIKSKDELTTTLQLNQPSDLSKRTNQQPPVEERQPSRNPILAIDSGMHTAPLWRISIDAANRYLVTGSWDKTVGVWDIKTGQLVRWLRPPIGEEREGSIYAVAISPDGNTIAAGGETGIEWDSLSSVYIFERSSGKLIKRLSQVGSDIRHLTFSRDGKYLAAAFGGKTKGIRLYRTVDYSLVREDKDYAKTCGFAEFDNSGRLATTSYDGFIRLYDVADGNLRMITKEKGRGGAEPYSVSFSPSTLPQEQKIAVGYEDTIKVDVFSGSDLSYLYSPDTTRIGGVNLRAVSWGSDGNTLYAAGFIIIRNKGVPIYTWPHPDKFWGSRKEIFAANNIIGHILPLKNGGIIYGAKDPAFGIIDKDNERKLFIATKKADYRDNQEGFMISDDGLTVKFNYETFGRSPAIFALRGRQLDTGHLKTLWSGLKPPITQASGINITNWKYTSKPKLNGQELKLLQKEESRCLSIAPSEEGFLLGTLLRLRFFDRSGLEKWQISPPAEASVVNISGNGRLAVTGLSDGTIRWYRMTDGKELLAFFPHNDMKRWVAWTPEGYFDASPGGAELVGYHINQGKDKEGKFVPMSDLYDVFYRPDIVQAKIQGEDISGLVTLTAAEALATPPPTVRFTTIPSVSSEPIAKVCYQVQNTGGGIGEVRLFQNGKLIKSDGFYREAAGKKSSTKTQIASLNSRAIYHDQRALIVREKETANSSTNKVKGDLIDECVEIETIAGDNEIGLAAFNAPNTVQGSMATMSFNSTRKPEEPHLYIVAVGIDNYRDASINLKHAAKDARDFLGKLNRVTTTLYKPENVHIVSLVDSKAGKQAILNTIQELSLKVKHSDGFIFFNASHGVLLENQYYIVTADFDGSLEKTDSLISSNEIVEMSKKIKSLSQLFVFDTCHAGGVDNIVSGLYDARMVNLARKMGLHIYASASDKQTAMDGYKGNGLFTHALLEGLNNNREADKDNDKKVSIVELGEYSKSSTTEISTKLGHSQTPVIINFGKDSPVYQLR